MDRTGPGRSTCGSGRLGIGRLGIGRLRIGRLGIGEDDGSMPDLTAGLVDRWFDLVVTPSTEPGSRWPLAVDIRLNPAERFVVREGHQGLRRALDLPGPVGDRVPDPGSWRQDPVCGQVGIFLQMLSAAIGDARRTLGAVADPDRPQDPARPAASAAASAARGDDGVQVDALAVAAGINAGAAALAGSGTDRFAQSVAAQAARRAGEAAAEAAVGGAGLPEVAARAAAAVLSGWDATRPDPFATAGDVEQARVRAIVGRVLVGLRLATRPPDPPARPAPCGAGPGDLLGRSFPAEITCEVSIPAAQVPATLAEVRRHADLVRFWPRSASILGGAAGASDEQWQRVHVHTSHPGAVVEILFARGSVFDLRIAALD